MAFVENIGRLRYNIKRYLTVKVLEIFSYDEMIPFSGSQINRCGLAHLALELILREGGTQIGEVVKADYEDGRKAVFVYAADCEGNIIELQNWH